MLKCAKVAEEMRGHAVMSWWDGQGAAKVYAHQGNALVIARATGKDNLAAMARGGQDTEALEILVNTAARLHRHSAPWPDVVTARERFAALFAAPDGPEQELADRLLQTPCDPVVLHGDLHHENILDFGEDGWLAIDPKGVLGPPALEYAPMLMNPGLNGTLASVVNSNMAERVGIIARLTGHGRAELLSWLEVYCALSACWSDADGFPASAIAARKLGKQVAALRASMR